MNAGQGNKITSWNILLFRILLFEYLSFIHLGHSCPLSPLESCTVCASLNVYWLSKQSILVSTICTVMYVETIQFLYCYLRKVEILLLYVFSRAAQHYVLEMGMFLFIMKIKSTRLSLVVWTLLRSKEGGRRVSGGARWLNLLSWFLVFSRENL